MVRRVVDKRVGMLLEDEPPLFQRAHDLTSALGRNENVVGEIGGDEEDGSIITISVS